MGKRAKDELPEGWLDKECGLLTVKKFLYSRYDAKGKRKDFFVECLCVCGKFHKVNSRMIQKKKVKSCGCGKGLMLSQELTKRTNKEGLNPLYFKKVADYKTKCKRKLKVLWDLTDAEAIELFQLPCTYCGRTLWSTTTLQGVDIMFPCNGIDRVVPNLGYIKSNVVPACDDCNTAKSNKSLQVFMTWRQTLVNNYSKIEDLLLSKIKEFPLQ